MNPQVNDYGKANSAGRVRPVVHRRTVLRGAMSGTAALAGLLLSSQTATAQSMTAIPTAAPTRRAVRSRRGLQTVHASDGAAIRLPLELGAVIGARQVGLAAGSTLTLSWDDRLYRMASKVRLTRASVNVLSQSARPVLDRSTHRATLSVVLPEALPAGADYALVAGMLAPARYPHDLVTDPVPVTLSVKEPGSADASITQVSSAAEAVDGQPWGVVLGAAWDRVGWGGGYGALHPTLVTFRSVGPGAVPAGSSLQVTLDPQVFAEVSVIGAFDSTGQEVPGKALISNATGKPTAIWTSSVPTAAGERITIRLDSTHRTLVGALPGLEAPLAAFAGPAGQDILQRLTGKNHLPAWTASTRPRPWKHSGSSDWRPSSRVADGRLV